MLTVGVPEMAPLVTLKLRPFGRFELISQLVIVLLLVEGVIVDICTFLVSTRLVEL